MKYWILALLAVTVLVVIWLLKTRAHLNEGYIDTTYSVRITNGTQQQTTQTWGNLGAFRNRISAALAATPLNDVQQMYINAITTGYKDKQEAILNDSDLLALAYVDNMNGSGPRVWDISGNGLLKQVSQRLPALSAAGAAEKSQWTGTNQAAQLLTNVARSANPPGESVKVGSGTVTIYGFVQLVSAALMRAQAIMPPAAFIYAQVLPIIDTIMAGKPITEQAAELIATADRMTGGGLTARNSSVASYQPAEGSRCPDISKYILKKDVDRYFLPRDAVKRDYMLRNEVETDYVKRDAIPCWGCTI